MKWFSSLVADYEHATSEASDICQPHIQRGEDFHESRRQSSEAKAKADRFYFAAYRKREMEVVWAWKYFEKEKEYQAPKLAYDMIETSAELAHLAAEARR